MSSSGYDIEKHGEKMGNISSHYQQVPDQVVIREANDFKEHNTKGIAETPYENPEAAHQRKQAHNRHDGNKYQPPHGSIGDHIKCVHSRIVIPWFSQDQESACQSQTPFDPKDYPAQWAAQGYKRNGRIGSRNQEIDGNSVNIKEQVFRLPHGQNMCQRGREVENDHGCAKNSGAYHMPAISVRSTPVYHKY